jgi:hypothetical protein
MNWTYIIPIIVLTALLTATIMNVIPLLKWYLPTYIARFKSRFKRKSNTSKSVDCVILEIRVNELEKKLMKRQENQRTAIRQEIKNILLELKNK